MYSKVRIEHQLLEVIVSNRLLHLSEVPPVLIENWKNYFPSTYGAQRDPERTATLRKRRHILFPLFALFTTVTIAMFNVPEHRTVSYGTACCALVCLFAMPKIIGKADVRFLNDLNELANRLDVVVMWKTPVENLRKRAFDRISAMIVSKRNLELNHGEYSLPARMDQQALICTVDLCVQFGLFKHEWMILCEDEADEIEEKKERAFRRRQMA